MPGQQQDIYKINIDPTGDCMAEKKTPPRNETTDDWQRLTVHMVYSDVCREYIKTNETEF